MPKILGFCESSETIEKIINSRDTLRYIFCLDNGAVFDIYERQFIIGISFKTKWFYITDSEYPIFNRDTDEFMGYSVGHEPVFLGDPSYESSGFGIFYLFVEQPQIRGIIHVSPN